MYVSFLSKKSTPITCRRQYTAPYLCNSASHVLEASDSSPREYPQRSSAVDVVSARLRLHRQTPIKKLSAHIPSQTPSYMAASVPMLSFLAPMASLSPLIMFVTTF
ncbi:Piso0_004674 [Millerozyma farinosa CBS 7064]|uniref:Piso0_004674 protein n=1 Tax=Pichia sorbitophila (strain ATCC MYA-4447 / BCRC 22081 / CBS 7064 / NBRC 10061 / NRRL Y-12695) TaxID=559304 RepID=G8Y641_PICSO|nr:Piso0_004674 [Millerozyma farinosa CBS 7064]CCE85102.1 Piso0_004674 [Millerozyma farinosa CBS 7064]